MLADPVSPLIAVDLSDGSALTGTASHPVYVDKGRGLPGAGWLEAGQLRVGDYVRTASGVDVVVAGLRSTRERALVYTLTVAKDHTFWGESHSDHTFFVGTARVLVHNCDTFSQSEIDTVVASSQRPASAQISKGAQAISKKLGHAEAGGYTSAFTGIPVNQAEAESLIRNILSHPAHVFRGNNVIDVYNAQGQGLRIDIQTGAFKGFLEGSLARQ